MNDFPRCRYGFGQKYPSIEIWKPRVLQNIRFVAPGRRRVYSFDPIKVDIGWTQDYDRCEKRCAKIAKKLDFGSNFDTDGNRTWK